MLDFKPFFLGKGTTIRGVRYDYTGRRLVRNQNGVIGRKVRFYGDNNRCESGNGTIIC